MVWWAISQPPGSEARSGGRGPLTQHLKRRAQDKTQVEPKRPSPDVCNVHVKRLAVAAVLPGGYLPEPGDSLGHIEPLQVIGLERICLVGAARPRADE